MYLLLKIVISHCHVNFRGCMLNFQGVFLQVLPSVPRLGKHCQDGAHKDAGSGWWSLPIFSLLLFLYTENPLLERFFFLFLFWDEFGTPDWYIIDMLYSILITLVNPTIDFNYYIFLARFWKDALQLENTQASAVEIPEGTLQEQLLRQCQVQGNWWR